MTAVLLGQKTDEEIEGQATFSSETEPASEHTHKAAFMILIDNDGHYVFEPNINSPVVPERSPTPSEIKGALSTVLMDIQTQETALIAAQQTVNAQMQLARQINEQAQNQAVLQQMRMPR